MELALVLAYAGFAALLIAVPGPDWALVLGAGTRPGLLAPVVGGLGLGYVGITTAIAVGLAPPSRARRWRSLRSASSERFICCSWVWGCSALPWLSWPPPVSTVGAHSRRRSGRGSA